MWTGNKGERRLVVINYAGNQSQCNVRLPDVGAGVMDFRDRMSAAAFERAGHDLQARGLFLDMPAWGYHVFDVTSR